MLLENPDSLAKLIVADLLSEFMVLITLLFLTLLLKSQFFLEHQSFDLLKELICDLRISNFYLAQITST